MRLWAKLLLVSVAYLFAALSMLGFLLILQGECFADVKCQADQHRFAVIGIVIVLLIYPFVLRYLFKRSTVRTN